MQVNRLHDAIVHHSYVTFEWILSSTEKLSETDPVKPVDWYHKDPDQGVNDKGDFIGSTYRLALTKIPNLESGEGLALGLMSERKNLIPCSMRGA